MKIFIVMGVLAYETAEPIGAFTEEATAEKQKKLFEDLKKAGCSPYNHSYYEIHELELNKET